MPDDGHLVVHNSDRERVLGQYVSSGGDRRRILKRYTVFNGDRVLVWSAFRDKDLSDSLSASTTRDHEDVEEISRTASASLSESITRETSEHAPPQVTGLTTTAIDNNQIDLSWDSADRADDYEIRRDGTVIETNITSTSYSNTSLADNTEFCYEVRACNTGGCGDWSSQSCATTAPAAPTVNSATYATGSKDVTVDWQNVSGETGYNVYVREDGTSSWSLLGSAGQDVANKTFTHNSATASTVFEFIVRSDNGTESENSNVVSDTTDSTPAAPSGISCQTQNDSSIEWTWTDNATVETGYEFDWREVGGTYTTVDLSVDANSHTVTGLNDETDYEARVRAINDFGSSSYDGPVTCTTTGVPTLNSASFQLGKKTVDMSWDNVSNNDGYNVYQREDGTSTWSFFGSTSTDVTSGSFSTNDFNANTTYDFIVRAKTPDGGVSGNSNIISDTSDPVPSTPTNVSATAVSESQIDVTWDNVSVELEFRIYRDGATSPTHTNNQDDTDWSDTGRSSDTQYCYEVSAWNEYGESTKSAQECATTDPSAPTAPSDVSASIPTCDGSKNVTVTWTDNSSNEDGFNIEQRVDGSGNAFSQLCQANANEESITCSAVTLTNGETYEFRVVAFNDGGETASTNTDTATMTSDPAAPSGCSASWDDGTGSSPSCAVDLSWTDNATNECGYKIYRKLQSESTYGSAIADIAADSTSYADTSANESTDYDYKIEAYNDVGTGDCVASVSTTTCEGGPN